MSDATNERPGEAIRVGYHALYPVLSDDGQRMWASQPEGKAIAVDVVCDSDLALIERMSEELAAKQVGSDERPGESGDMERLIVDQGPRNDLLARLQAELVAAKAENGRLKAYLEAAERRADEAQKKLEQLCW